MGRFRITIAGTMVIVFLTALLLVFFQTFSFFGLLAIAPLGVMTLFIFSERSWKVRAPALAGMFAGTILIPFLVAIELNYIIWGYHLYRPSVDGRIVDAKRIERISYVTTVTDTNGRKALVGEPLKSVENYRPTPSPDGDYYLLEGRVTRELFEHNHIPAKLSPVPASELEKLYELIDRTGRLEAGEAGYYEAKTLAGIVVEAIDHDDRPLMFVAVRGREVSNDHYPFYELLFQRHSTNAGWSLISFQRFYYDVAGMEGAEWQFYSRSSHSW